jgi:polyisoprenyl-teichoic acid--peptidoglycan teichoic acid transferase
MASGRSSGGSGPEGRRPGNDPYRGLANLGDGPAATPAPSASGGVANEGGLRALGQQIDGRPPRRGGGGGRGRRGGHRRPGWSRRKKVLTTLFVVFALLLIAVGGSYAYLRYDFGQVTKIACSACAPPVNDAISPFNVLIVGSDSRAGNTGQAARSFGTASEVGGQRSDTIKILHVDPQTRSAELLSIPRDTWVEMSGLPADSGLAGPNKINTAFNNGPVPLVETIQNTFGIPIEHFVVVDFGGLINAVQSVGGINMHFNYPVRDNDNGNNNSGLDVTTTGCITLNGNETLALARSRYFEYDDPAEGGWTYDPTSDIGRIERQNLIIDALMQKVESTYNPLTLKSFLDAVVHDIAIDQNLGLGELYSLASTYHAFSPSRLTTYTLPTTGAQTAGGADIEVVEEPEAQQLLTAFLGTPPEAITTPPLDEFSDPISVPAGSGATTSTSSAVGAGSTTSTTSSVLAPTPIAAYDPTPC